MSKEERNGKRKTRIELYRKRKQKLGYYLIVTDTEETEKNYFYGLKNSLPHNYQEKIVIKVVNKCKTSDLVERALDEASIHSQYVQPWIVFDRDKVTNFDEIISKAERNSVHVGWSNPCIEIWFFAYFDKMPNYTTSTQCVSEFCKIYKAKTELSYTKSYTDIYKKLNETGSENNAIELAKKKIMEHRINGKLNPSDMCPSTTVYQLVEEIKNKIKA